MEIFGEVAAIVNDKFVLVKVDPSRSPSMLPGVIIQVFSGLEAPQLASLGLPKLYTLKGSLRIVLPQTDDFFLAERYVEGERIEQRPTGLGSLQGLFTQEVKVGGTWSAKIDESQSLHIDFETEVRAGDPVGRA